MRYVGACANVASSADAGRTMRGIAWMPSDFSATYQAHLKDEHKISRLSENLKEIVYGGNDGIVTTFAIVAGFAGASMHETGAAIGGVAVLLFGLANLFADATAMGLGAFLSARSEQDVYDAERVKEVREIERNPEFERAEVVEILRERGVSAADAAAFADLYLRNPDLMADFMMQYEIGMSDPSDGSPAMEGLITFLSFIVFGAIPLLPYFFFAPTREMFNISVALTLLGLVLLGVVRWWASNERLARCVAETVAVGGTCAIVAYAVGLAFAL